jgi:hypothetical protein
MGVYSSACILFSSFNQEPIMKGSWNSIVRIVASHTLNSPRFKLQYEREIFFCSTFVQTGSGADPACSSVGSGVISCM